MEIIEKNTGKYQPKTHEKKTTTSIEAEMNIIFCFLLFGLVEDWDAKIQIIKYNNTRSFQRDSFGVKERPTDPFIASPKQPQSSTHWIGIPDKVSPGIQVAVCKVRNVKKINIEKMKNNDVLIFALTIKANPKTISKTEIKTASKRV